MERTDEAKTETQHLSDILIDIASQFLLAVVVDQWCSGRQYLRRCSLDFNLSRTDSFVSMQIGEPNTISTSLLLPAGVLILLVRRIWVSPIGLGPPTAFMRFNKTANRWISAWVRVQR